MEQNMIYDKGGYSDFGYLPPPPPPNMGFLFLIVPILSWINIPMKKAI
jgi:hypothetical protein